MLSPLLRFLTVTGPIQLVQILRNLPPNMLRALAATVRAAAALAAPLAVLRVAPLHRAVKLLVGTMVLLFVVGMTLALTVGIEDGSNPVMDGEPPERHVAQAILAGAAALLAAVGLFIGRRLMRLWRGDDD